MSSFLERAVRSARERAKSMRIAQESANYLVRPTGRFLDVVRRAYNTLGWPAVIVEYKRCAPGRVIANIDPWEYVKLTKQYATAYSVLTEPFWFCGSSSLVSVFACEKPVLYKDFIVDEAQLLDAVANQASAVLLIADALSWGELDKLFTKSRSTGLDVLIEAGEPLSLVEVANSFTDAMIGLNSRDLHTLRTDFRRMVEGIRLLKSRVPSRTVIVAESGIRSVRDYLEVSRAGANAALIGTAIMEKPEFLHELHELVTANTSTLDEKS